MSRWTLLLSLVSAMVLGSGAPVSAVPLLPGETVMTPGTTMAARPELMGEVVAAVSSSASGFTLETRVVRELGGTLDFYYRIVNTAMSASDLGRLIITPNPFVPFVAFTSDVDWMADSAGEVGSRLADRNVFDFGAVNLTFLFDGLLPRGQSSHDFLLRTDARGFDRGTIWVADGEEINFWGLGAGAIVPAAVPEPGTLALLGSGLVGMLGAAWRRRNASPPPPGTAPRKRVAEPGGQR